MKTIICGSRSVTNYALLEQAIKESGFKITEVVCGMAKGADSLGFDWATANGIPIKEFPADWKNLGRKAGVLRNVEMLDYAGANGCVIALHQNNSAGTKHTISEANKRRMKVYVKVV